MPDLAIRRVVYDHDSGRWWVLDGAGRCLATYRTEEGAQWAARLPAPPES